MFLVGVRQNFVAFWYLGEISLPRVISGIC